MTPAGTSNELDVQNEWEENTTHTPQVSRVDIYGGWGAFPTTEALVVVVGVSVLCSFRVLSLTVSVGLFFPQFRVSVGWYASFGIIYQLFDCCFLRAFLLGFRVLLYNWTTTSEFLVQMCSRISRTSSLSLSNLQFYENSSQLRPYALVGNSTGGVTKHFFLAESGIIWSCVLEKGP